MRASSLRSSRRLVLAAALFAPAVARAQPVKIRLGTATPGGGFPVYGAAFVEAVRRGDPELEIDAINTKGSTENVPRLEAGTLDIALVQGEVVHEALQGIGRPPADLRGQPGAWGAQGSGLVILGRYAMDGLGLDAAKDFQPVYLERAGDGPAIDGHEDARATEARAGERGNALDKRHAARQVFAPRHVGGELSWRFDRDPIADHGRGAGIDAIQTDRRALARIPQQARRRREPG